MVLEMETESVEGYCESTKTEFKAIGDKHKLMIDFKKMWMRFAIEVDALLKLPVFIHLFKICRLCLILYIYIYTCACLYAKLN